MSEDITMAAVMECLAESSSVQKYWQECHSKNVDCTLIDIVKNAKPEDDDIANIQIIRDYITEQRLSGNNVGDYVLHDCSPFGYDENHNGVVGNDETSAQLYGRSVLVSDGKIGSGTDNVWVAFNGSSDHEWIDNGEGLYQESTIAQRAAAERFDQYVQDYNIRSDDNVTVTGHSKGGNKAMYVTMNSHYAKMIDSCVALDGQGFSPEAIEHWKEIYGEQGFMDRCEKITLVYGRKDYVHELGICIANPDKIITLDYQEGTLNFYARHAHQYLFQQDSNGNFTSELNPQCKPNSKLEKLLNSFMSGYMKLGTKERENSAPAVMIIFQDLLGDGESTDIDGKKIKFNINKVIEALYLASNGSGLMDDLALLLCLRYPYLAGYILGYIAYLKISGKKNNEKNDNNYKEERSRLILLNEEAFIDMNARFETAFSYAKEGSYLADKAERINPDLCKWFSMIKMLEVKSEDISKIMTMIIRNFKNTEKDLVEKTDRIGEDYLDAQIVGAMLKGQNVFVTGDGSMVVCPTVPDISVIESGDKTVIHNCIEEYANCFDAIYAA